MAGEKTIYELRIIKLRDIKSQVWVETVIYTLIALAIMGLVLAFAMPKVNEIKDKAVIEQAIEALNELDAKILESSQVAGNKRIVDFRIGKGKFVIDSASDLFLFVLEDSRVVYSESGVETNLGNIKILTEKKAKTSKITLKLDYKDKLNITYNNEEKEKTLQQAPSPYKLSIENKGRQANLTNIDINEVS